MFMAWFFWLFVLLGGLFMGLMALIVSLETGFTVAGLLNVVVYLGCGLAAIPRLWRLAKHPPAMSSH